MKLAIFDVDGTLLDNRASEEAAGPFMNWRDHIWIDSARMHGTPCMRDTRVPVYVVLDSLAAGETAESILSEYPSLRPEHIHAAIAYAAVIARNE